MLNEDDIHCMLDLETLGDTSTSAIIQIGACIFNETEIFHKFKVNILWHDALKYGEVTASTLHWWMSQSNEARNSMLANGVNCVLAATNFITFCSTKKPIDHFWAHATFDFPILDNFYRKLGIRSSIDFRKTRDLRTAEVLLPDIKWPERKGIHHDALDDALYQTEFLQLMLRGKND